MELLVIDAGRDVVARARTWLKGYFHHGGKVFGKRNGFFRYQCSAEAQGRLVVLGVGDANAEEIG